jgi:hypothetical protein
MLLYAPLAPLNPVEQDTIPSLAVHFDAGMSSPNGVVSAGPEAAAMLEMLLFHPIMVRGGLGGKYGQIRSHLYPNGNLYTLQVAADLIYYRGTDRLTGFIGVGGFYTANHFDPLPRTADSLYRTEGMTGVNIEPKFGYRITLGLRIHRIYSLEMTIDDLRPNFRKTGSTADGVNFRAYQATHTGSFRLAVGYIVPI